MPKFKDIGGGKSFKINNKTPFKMKKSPHKITKAGRIFKTLLMSDFKIPGFNIGNKIGIEK